MMMQYIMYIQFCVHIMWPAGKIKDSVYVS